MQTSPRINQGMKGYMNFNKLKKNQADSLSAIYGGFGPAKTPGGGTANNSSGPASTQNRVQRQSINMSMNTKNKPTPKYSNQ